VHFYFGNGGIGPPKLKPGFVGSGREHGATHKQHAGNNPSMFSPLAQYCSHHDLPGSPRLFDLPLTNFGGPNGAGNGLATLCKVDDLLREKVRPFIVDRVAGGRQKQCAARGHFHAWRNAACLCTQICADILYPTQQQHTLRILQVESLLRVRPGDGILLTEQ
jgi:hypothetical protein